MNRHILLALAGVATLIAHPAAAAPADMPSWQPGMPVAIPALRDTMLPPELYETRLAAWETYLQANPSSGFAATQVARGLRYLRRDTDRQAELIEGAVARSPECPEALESWANVKAYQDTEKALARLRRAIELAPRWHVPHLTLWNIHVVEGEDELARTEIAQAHAKGAFSHTLMDFAHNLLVSAEAGSILLTNGDNDTYPLLALQACYGLRTDVAVLNIPMLNVPRYAERMISLGLLTEAELRELESGDGTLAQRILEWLIASGSRAQLARPLQFSVTASNHLDAHRSHFRLQGLVLQLVPGENVVPVDVDRTLELAREEFRLESILDYSRTEGRFAVARMLSNNYPAMLLAAAEEAVEQSRPDAANEALDRTVHLFVLLGDRPRAESILEYWNEIAPGNAQAAAWATKVATMTVRPEDHD